MVGTHAESSSCTPIEKRRPPLPIETRPWSQSDVALVYDAWLRKIHRTSPYSRLPANWLFAAQRALINALVARPEVQVLVACAPGNEAQVYGFAVGEPAGAVLHWVYTKDRGVFRRAKVATRLIQALFGSLDGIVATASTPEFKAFLPRARVDAYALTERVR
jgi:hypothetical protein